MATALVLAALPASAEAPGSPAGPTGLLGWLPANAGVMWWQGADSFGIPPAQPPGEAGGAWWLTRRIGTSPLLPEVQHLGSLFHGLYVSAGGGGWVNLSPGCLLPLRSPVPQAQDLYRPLRQIAVAATGLDACGVEGIAYDPLLPNRIYASAYTVEDVSLSGALLGPGGVYVSDSLGASWRKLVGGLRGNGLAVARDGTGPARIVVGYIQAHNGSIGATPDGGSLSISDDDGRTWRPVHLPSSGCAEAVPTTQRITPSVAMPPDDPDLIYAGTNAGLYASTDGGASFTLLRQACGGTWGVALSPGGDQVWIGDHEGRVFRAATGSSSFTQLVDLGAGKVQHLLLDPDGRTLYAAMWDGNGASVYRIDGQTGARAQLGDSLLEPIDRSGFPRPFPLGPEMANGTMPSLFLGRAVGRLEVSTVLRGVFVRLE